MDDYLAKPYRLRDLRRVLRDYVGSRASAPEREKLPLKITILDPDSRQNSAVTVREGIDSAPAATAEGRGLDTSALDVTAFEDVAEMLGTDCR